MFVLLVLSLTLSLNILFRFALKKRDGCPLEIITLFVYSVFSFDLKKPIIDLYPFFYIRDNSNGTFLGKSSDCLKV